MAHRGLRPPADAPLRADARSSAVRRGARRSRESPDKCGDEPQMF